MIELSRRRLIGAGAASFGAMALAGSSQAEALPFFARTGLPIGLQLYTLADQAKGDLEGTLKAVASIGFKTIELAGYAGRAPAEFRQALDAVGLSAPSAHVQVQAQGGESSLDGDLSRLADEAHILGVKMIVMPIFYAPERFDLKPRAGEAFGQRLGRIGGAMTADDWKFNADFLNTKGAVLKKSGLQLAYHNHNAEFSPLAGGKPGARNGYEILLARTDPALVSFEMDAGWVSAAGHDPFALLKDHPGRFVAMHVKDIKATTKPNFVFVQDPTEVGSGMIDWKRLLPAAHAAGVRDFFVEQEPPFAHSRLESVGISFDYLSKLRA
ncbi:sugar phosphate isomerase/epimerase [soil metagenome]